MQYLNGDLGRDEATLWSMHEVDVLHNVGHRIDMDNLGLHSTAAIDASRHNHAVTNLA